MYEYLFKSLKLETRVEHDGFKYGNKLTIV